MNLHIHRSSIRSLALLQNCLSSSLLLSPHNSALADFFLLAFNALEPIVLLESHPHMVFLCELRLVLFLPHFASGLLTSVCGWTTRRLTTSDLPLHELRESTFFVSCELGVRADLCDAAVGANADNDVAALNCAKAMGDGDGGIVALEKLREGLVDEGFGLGVEGRCGFVEDENIRVFEQGTRDGDALLLAAGKLGAAGTGGGVETFGLRRSVS